MQTFVYFDIEDLRDAIYDAVTDFVDIPDHRKDDVKLAIQMVIDSRYDKRGRI
jgi:hypothetical protein